MHRAIRSVVAQFSDNNLVARPFPDGVRGHSRGGMGIGSRAEKRGEEKGHQDIHDSIFHERAFLRGAKNGVAMMSSEVFGVPRRGKLVKDWADQAPAFPPYSSSLTGARVAQYLT